MALSMQKMRQMLEEFSALAANPQARDEEVDSIAQTLLKAGYKHELAEVMNGALSRDNAHPHLGALWIQKLVTSHSWDREYPAYLGELCSRGEIGTRALKELLEYLNEKGKPSLIRKVVSRHGALLREDAGLRSLVAGALCKAKLYSHVPRWSQGPAEQLDDRALFCRAMALRQLGKERAAQSDIAQAVNRSSTLAKHPVLGVWHAMEQALRGENDQASAVLDSVRASGWDEDEQTLYYLARGVVRVQKAAKEERRKAFYAAFDRVHDKLRHRRKIHVRPWPMRRAYRRCMGRMAMAAGLKGRALQAVWESADSPFVLAAMLVIPPLQLLSPVYAWRLASNRGGKKSKRR